MEVRNVIGMRCVGISHDGDRVRTVESRERGSWEVGVRIRRVRAASIGARRRADRPVAAVAIRTVAIGDVEANMFESDILAAAASASSVSATPKTAAKKLRKKVSKVRSSTVYRKVEFVPRHIEIAPLFDESEDKASMIECGFFIDSLSGDVGRFVYESSLDG